MGDGQQPTRPKTGSSRISLELPGDLKTLDDLHLRSPLPARRRRHKRQSSFDAAQKTRSGENHKKASLTEVEAFVLHRLLIDEPESKSLSNQTHKQHNEERVLNDEILFSVPHATLAHGASNEATKKRHPQKPKRPSISGLWKAHAAGVAPKELIKKGLALSLEQNGLSKSPGTDGVDVEALGASTHLARTYSGTILPATSPISARSKSNDVSKPKHARGRYRRAKSETSKKSTDEDSYEDFCPSDEEVRPKDHESECGSWDDEDHLEHFDAWEILKDEYATDFGFDSHVSPSSFLILGTSADDDTARPHVMSPPLMDALMKYLPPTINGDNFWLKFSLVRDGANLETLKRYVRSSRYTILAIETDRGEVFGSFTSSPWRNNFGFFGTAPAFVWKMRNSRQTRCASLFDQANLESQIDVYPYSGKMNLVQVCRHDLLAVGGDDTREENFTQIQALAGRGSALSDRSGFALALEEDLLRGTTSPCSTFRSPAICGNGETSCVFYTSGLEVWTLTPCRDVDSAEKVEMTRFFIEESTRDMASSTRSSSSSPMSSPRTSSRWGSKELIQEEFFKRVGHDPESEERRQMWQYRNAMDGDVGRSANRGFASTPRFGYQS